MRRTGESEITTLSELSDRKRAARERQALAVADALAQILRTVAREVDALRPLLPEDDAALS